MFPSIRDTQKLHAHPKRGQIIAILELLQASPKARTLGESKKQQAEGKPPFLPLHRHLLEGQQVGTTFSQERWVGMGFSREVTPWQSLLALGLAPRSSQALALALIPDKPFWRQHPATSMH